MAVDITSLVTENLDTWSSTIKAKAATGRGSKSKRELYGVKKLRELILDLAVRGLLVPQDPNDEPASILLEKIAAEKTQLIKEKKIKKQKSLPPVADDDWFTLPEGWKWSRLGVLSSDIHYGYTASAQHDFEGVRLLRITDIQDDKVSWESVPGCVITAEKSQGYLLENDDILIARTGGTIGKSYLVENINVDAVFASYLIRVKRISAMYAPYIKTYLGSQIYWSQLYENSAGTGQPNVNATALKNIIVPIPPLDEQHRIVTKVNELMALCDQLEQQQENSITAHETLVETLLNSLVETASHTQGANANQAFQQAWQRIAENFDLLFTTEHSIQQLKQTILQLAVMGKLVPQDPNDEPASVLLEKIAAEKAQLIKEKKIKKQKPLPPIGEDEKPFALPEGWEWCRLDDPALNSEAGWSPKCHGAARENGKWGVLKVSAVTWGRFNPEENKELPDDLDPRPEYEVKENDFLISRANTAELVARSVVVPANTESRLMMSDKIIRFVFSSSAYPEYLSLVNNSKWARIYYASVAGGTSSSMKNVSRKQIQMLLVALPPLVEQKRIMLMVEQLMTLCDNMLERIKAAQTTQLNLTNAIAEQAVG